MARITIVHPIASSAIITKLYASKGVNIPLEICESRKRFVRARAIEIKVEKG